MLFKQKKYIKKLFIIVYSFSVLFGAIFDPAWIWEVADLAIGGMTVINVTVITLMNKEVKKETELYIKKG